MGAGSCGACSRTEYGRRRGFGAVDWPLRRGPRGSAAAAPASVGDVMDRLCGNSKLTCAEGDDAADRIVGRNADGDPVARHDLDAEPAHAAAQLGEHFVPGVATARDTARRCARPRPCLECRSDRPCSTFSSFQATIVPHQGCNGGQADSRLIKRFRATRITHASARSSPHRVFHLLGKRRVVVAVQPSGAPKRDARPGPASPSVPSGAARWSSPSSRTGTTGTSEPRRQSSRCRAGTRLISPVVVRLPSGKISTDQPSVTSSPM